MEEKREKFDETFLRETRGDSWVDGIKLMARNYAASYKKNQQLVKDKDK